MFEESFVAPLQGTRSASIDSEKEVNIHGVAFVVLVLIAFSSGFLGFLFGLVMGLA